MSELDSFSDDQRRALACVLDRLIPADSDLGMPGAAEILLDEHIDSVLRKNPGFDQSIAAGLAAIDELAGAKGAPNFESLSAAEQTDVMNEVGASQPGFLPGLIFHTYVGYYQDARVVTRLGVEHHPPYPNGFELEPGDLSLLEPVKQRGKQYRNC